MTLRSIFEKLQQSGPLSRADLTRETGISAPTVSKVVTELIEQGLVEETSHSDNLLGRPGKRLSLANSRSRVLGINVDAARTTLTTASLDGQIDLHRCLTLPTPGSYGDWLLAVVEFVERVSRTEPCSFLGMGICIPGMVSRDSQQVLNFASVPFLEGCNVSRDLLAETGVRTAVVPQGQGLAIAERLFGSARWLSDFVMLDASDGPSVGIYSDGELLSGSNGLAGPFELLRLNPVDAGPSEPDLLLETDRRFVEAVSLRIGQPLTLDEIWHRVQLGELSVDRELEALCRTFAANAAAAINLFNPSTLYLYSQVPGFQAELMPDLIQTAEQFSLNHSFEGCEIWRAAVTPQDAAIAAIIDEITRSLGPRLNQNGSTDHGFTTQQSDQSGVNIP